MTPENYCQRNSYQNNCCANNYNRNNSCTANYAPPNCCTKNCSKMKRININQILMRTPDAVANIRGSSEYPGISGKTGFYQTEEGVLVVTEVWGLPQADDNRNNCNKYAKCCKRDCDNVNKCNSTVYGYHIHSGNRCQGNNEDAFADAKAHYNPDDCQHPYHAGDMPPLFGNNGYAYMSFLTNRFCIREIIGKTVIIHLEPDDFHTQPSGASGTKIACGVIESAKYTKK